MNYFNKLWTVLNSIDKESLNVEFDATRTGSEYKQEVFDLSDDHLYEIVITREELRNLNHDELKDAILYKIKNERYIA